MPSEQRFPIPPLPPTERLYFSFLEPENAGGLVNLFENEANTFIDKRFKTESSMMEYAAGCAWTRSKGWGADYVVYLTETNLPVGLLHLYDLPFIYDDDDDDNFISRRIPLRCSVGFIIGQAFRRRGLAFEGLACLLKTVDEAFPMIEYCQAQTELDNEASGALLIKAGFELLSEPRLRNCIETKAYLRKTAHCRFKSIEDIFTS